MSIYIYTIAMLTHKMSYLGTVNYTYKLRYFLEKLSRRNFYYYLNFLLHSKIFHDYYIDILKFR
ncbi:MAG: hypothetical protein KDH96_10050 [Candidatus Riesia sp.]|nr:hypothetical protein [Candidatus Riesia sp.]